MDLNLPGMFVLLFTVIFIMRLYAKTLIATVFFGIWDVICIIELVKGLMKFHQLKMQERKTILFGKKCPAKIIAYEVEPLFKRYRNSYGGVSSFEKKIFYYLHVRFDYNGNTRTVHTPALLYNPLAVLKSPNCAVYVHGSQFTVTEFDFRTDRKSEKIKLKRIMNWDKLNH